VFTAVWTRTLRQFRFAIVGLGVALALLVYPNYTAARAVIAAGVAQLAESLRFLAEPVAIDTVPGYVTFRVMSLILPAMVSVWAILAGSRLVRGEEERGWLDIVLSTPRSRTRVLSEKLAALVLALLLMALLLSLGVLAGQAGAGEPLAYGRALLAALNVSLMALTFGSVALLLSQLLPSRAAAGWTATLLAAAFLADSTGRTVRGASWLEQLSPLHYYNTNKPLIAGYPAEPGAAAVLVGLCLVLVGGSLLLFARRDVGGAALVTLPQRSQRPHRSNAATLARSWRTIWVRAISLRALRAQVGPAVWWTLVTAAFASWSTLLVPTLREPIQRLIRDSPVFAELFASRGVNTDTDFLAGAAFQFLPAALAAVALVQAAYWPEDLNSGRLEVVFSTPRSRIRLLLERFLAVLIVALLSPLAIWMAILASARVADLAVGADDLATACLTIVPLELLTAALVYALAGRIPYGAVVGVTGAVLAVSFLADFLQEAFDLPEWLSSLSMFHHYGNPIIDGPAWGPAIAMLGIAAALLALAAVQFRGANLPR
jgi:ABC-2 type transport system permease protein